MEERPPVWRVAANILNKKSQTADKGWSSNLGVGRGVKTPQRKSVYCYEILKDKGRIWTDNLVRPKQRKRNMRFGACNVWNLYRSGSFIAAARELATYKLDLVGVHEVRWDKGGTVSAGDSNYFCGKGNKNLQLRTGFFVHHRIVAEVKRIEFVSDRVSYIWF